MLFDNPTADALFTQGVARHEAGDLVSAGFLYRAALNIDPNIAQAWANLAISLADQGHEAASVTCARKALLFGGSDAALHSSVGNVLWRAELYDEAIPVLELATRLAPTMAAAKHNLALAYNSVERHSDAMLCFFRALELDTESKAAAYDASYAVLGGGNFAAGLRSHEARWIYLARSPAWDCGAPRWEGQDLFGKIILVHHEQGFGDTLMLLRYLPELVGRGAIVRFAAPESLRELVAAQGYVDSVVPVDGPYGVVDYHSPMMSIPLHLGASFETVPSSDKPYVRVESGTPIFAPEGRTAVGIVWRSANTGLAVGTRKSLPLAELLPLAEIPGVDLYSLQMGPSVDDVRGIGADCIVRDLSDHLTSFLKTAQVVKQLDVVVTVDTAVAHLAGALGKECFILLPFVKCWRWRCTDSGSPWYGNTRLFQQRRPGAWGEAVGRARDAVEVIARKKWVKACR